MQIILNCSRPRPNPYYSFIYLFMCVFSAHALTLIFIYHFFFFSPFKGKSPKSTQPSPALAHALTRYFSKKKNPVYSAFSTCTMALTFANLSRGLVASSPVLKLWRETYGTNADLRHSLRKVTKSRVFFSFFPWTYSTNAYLRRAHELADDGDAAGGGVKGGGAVRELWFGVTRFSKVLYILTFLY